MPSTELVRFKLLHGAIDTRQASPNSKITGVGGIDVESWRLSGKRLFGLLRRDIMVVVEFLAMTRCYLDLMTWDSRDRNWFGNGQGLGIYSMYHQGETLPGMTGIGANAPAVSVAPCRWPKYLKMSCDTHPAFIMTGAIQRAKLSNLYSRAGIDAV